MVDNGPPGILKFWRNLSVIGTLANGKGIGEAEEGETQVIEVTRSEIRI